MSDDQKVGPKGYGCFRYGSMNLAVPIGSLREVVPYQTLTELPSSTHYVAGAIDLRGILVPVLNLARLFNKTEPEQELGCIIVIRHQGKVVGLLANEIQGLYFLDPEQCSPIHSEPGAESILSATLKHSDINLISSLLNVPSLFLLKGWIAAQDQEIGLNDQNAMVAIKEQNQTGMKGNIPLMLLKSKNHEFAVNPTDVEATFSNPDIKTQEFSNRLFLGTFNYRGDEIPAIDLCELLGLSDDAQSGNQMFVVRTAHGAIGLAIDEVLEITEIKSSKLAKVPTIGFSKPQYYASILDNCDLPESIVRKIKPTGCHQLILNIETIKNATEVIDLTKTYHQNTKKNHDTKNEYGTQNVMSERRLITFQTHREMATPVEEVSEILRYSTQIEKARFSCEVLGVLTNRGKSIPVFDTAFLIDGIQGTLDENSSVLVFDIEGSPLGFAVQRLRSIEPINWENVAPSLGQTNALEIPDRKEQRIVEVGTADEKRVLDVIDFVEIARWKLKQHKQASHCASNTPVDAESETGDAIA